MRRYEDDSDDGACTCTLRGPVFFLCRRDGSSELVLTSRRSLKRGLSLRLILRTMSVGSSSLSSSLLPPNMGNFEIVLARSYSQFFSSERGVVGWEVCLP